MLKWIATAAILASLAGSPVFAQEVAIPQPYQLTSRGVIADAASEAYKDALESCYRGTPGDAPSGAQFLACLKQQYNSAGKTLTAAYDGTVSALKSFPGRAARLRDSQAAWLKFRDENCAFAKAVAPKSDAEAFLYDCLLRTTIERRVELRSLVGD
jgi:uncharacterized protein YecT (DUF1311 family)